MPDDESPESPREVPQDAQEEAQEGVGASPEVPSVIYSLSIQWNPKTGGLALNGPFQDRGVCYLMLGLALEKLVHLGIQQEILAAQEKQRGGLVTPGGAPLSGSPVPPWVKNPRRH